MATIDTTSQQYQKYITGLDNIRAFYTPKLVLFARLPVAEKRAWLQKDPLIRKLLKLSADLTEFANRFRDEVQG